MRIFNLAWRWALAVVVTTVAASAAHSWSVQRSLAALGVEIPAGTAWRTAATDLVGLAPALGGVLAIALAAGFLVAGFLGPRLRVPALLAYPLAGSVAVGVTLGLMRWQMNITPIAGAREAPGFALLCAAGGLGGLIFVLSRRR